ncbi:HAD-IB family phosphatase [Maricaulis maris]|uniref:phosphoserine phosphatase n=1 Tax=Maricaulis maris TaxID=74318 RepID=A0A495D3A7_9PROT|nr:HAD-IB family phosphatase [Maricaulis maris]RKQ96258.1 phosphoserine phosphatase [Maricaulis maris]
MTRLIAFDVDSTLLRVESLDSALEAALAMRDDKLAAKARLHEITRAGMSGSMALRDSLEARLELAALDRAGVDAVAEQLRQRLTPGMAPLIRKLRARGDVLHAVSGGFADLLEPVLGDLGFGQGDIHANRFIWNGDQVSGLDTDYPLSRNGGKAEILNTISGKADETIMVGDGMTDFEAYEAGAADRFIGFGLIAKREVVIAACEWSGASYVRTVDGLAKALGV